VRRVELLVTACVLLSCATSAPSIAPVTATVPPMSTTEITSAPTRSPAPNSVLGEAAAWSRVKSATQSSVAMPMWLPASIDRASVELRDLVAAPSEPRYSVLYRTPQGAAIVFALGPADPIPGSGTGIVVRGQDASLTFPSTAFAEPTKPATRRVRWMEGPLVFSITSDTFTGDDLLHIAWNLDPWSAPPPRNAFSRMDGACGAGTPEDTMRGLVALLGRRDAVRIADCFSDEFLGRSGMGVPSGWSALPSATLDAISPRQPVGGRPVLQVNWTWSANPGGAWNNPQTMFFTLGLDHDRYRIYGLGTAGSGAP
jgi:hypothetical protein